jgi:hypothetical protein
MGEGPLEEDAAGGQGIDGGSARVGVAVAAQPVGAEGIDGDEEEVGAGGHGSGRLGGRGAGGEESREREDKENGRREKSGRGGDGEALHAGPASLIEESGGAVKAGGRGPSFQKSGDKYDGGSRAAGPPREEAR